MAEAESTEGTSVLDVWQEESYVKNINAFLVLN